MAGDPWRGILQPSWIAPPVALPQIDPIQGILNVAASLAAACETGQDAASEIRDLARRYRGQG